MKLFEIFIRLVAILGRTFLGLIIIPLEGVRDIAFVLLDEACLPLLGQTRSFIDQIEHHGIKHSRDEVTAPAEPKLWDIFCGD